MAPHPLKISRWSRYRNRQTLFVTTSETEALKLKPPAKVVFMSYENGVYKDTTVRDGSKGGWSYKHKNQIFRSSVNGQSRSAQLAVTLISKRPKKSTVRGFNHFYAWGFPEVFDGSNEHYLNSGTYRGWNTQIEACVVNADGSGFEMNCEEVRTSPIGIDLNDDDKVNRIDGIFRFALDNQGSKDFLDEWFAPTERILIDATNSGEITGENLFGDEGRRFEDGYAKLSKLKDKNEDGMISGNKLKGLKIWVDLDSNAELDEETELFDLNDRRLDINIESISTVDEKFVSSATQFNGTDIMTEDLSFKERENSGSP